jgi:uncharacterized protein (TIGR01777 family)
MAQIERYLARSPMPASARALFDWHARPGAFERLNPPFHPVQLLERPSGISVGARTVLRVHLGPVPSTWVAVHTALQDGASFSDRQESGPFALWEQTHRMLPDGPERSFLEDEVHYRLPLGWLGSLSGGAAVRGKLESLFAYRHALTAADLARHGALPGPALRVGITGSHGLIGTALTHFLTTGGHAVQPLPRVATPERLEGLDAVVHLAGASLADGRWTAARKDEIRTSRVEGTARLVGAMRACSRPPRTLIAASAIGLYGDRGSELLEESAAPGRGFLAEVCQAWEAAARPAEDFGTRLVSLRTGIVLSPNGGALAKLAPIFRAGLGGRVGPGTQFYSWIGLEDVVGAIHFALRRPDVRGPLNLTAPEPVSNSAFAEALGDVLHRPTVFSVPSAAVRALFGEMGEATVLASGRVLPRALLGAGFRFRWQGLRETLRFCLGLDRLPGAS